MNKLIYILLSLIILSGVASAFDFNSLKPLANIFDKNDNWAYLECYKETNGRQVFKLPSIEWSHRDGIFLYEPTLALLFTSPRGGMFQFPNHHSIQANFNFGVQFMDFFATTSLDSTYYIAGNDDGIPEHLALGNTTRIGFKF